MRAMAAQKASLISSLAQPESGRGTSDPRKLRELAAWYREFAERTDNPMIWECRLHTADDLDAEATRLEQLAGGRCERAAATARR
jgi:hypothetical protein